MSEHGGMPEGWLSLSVAILWAIFAFAFGFEAVVNFNDWLLGQGPSYAIVAAVDALLCLFIAITALVLWKGRIILPTGFITSANRAASNASVWTILFMVILVVLGLPHFITHMTFSVSSSGPPQTVNSTVVQTPEDVLELITSLRSQLTSANATISNKDKDLITARRELDAARRPPLSPEKTPTWIELDFDDKGKPKEVDSTNIHWAWWRISKDTITIESPPQQPSSPFAGVPILMTPSPPKETKEITYTTLLFLSFDRPIKYDQIYLKSNSGLPNWETYGKEERVGVVWIHER